MKVLILFTLIFCFYSLAINIPECHRCIEMADTIGLYCQKYKNECNQEKFANFLTETCERFISVDKLTCASESELAGKVWATYNPKLSANSICQAAGICPAKLINSDYFKHPLYRNFAQFKSKYNKKYINVNEESKRARIFFNNMKRIDAMNKYSKDNQHTTVFGVTEFADLNHYEFKLNRISKLVAVKDPNVPTVTEVNFGDLPTSYDWRTKGAVTPVKNQGQCGSCWSFSTTGNVEGQWFLSGHKLVGLSEQNLVDCDHECMMYENQQSCDAGCDGGLMMNAFKYILTNGGIDTEASYPYLAVDGTCAFNKTNVGATINNYTMISQNETVMAEYLVANGPVSIAADAVEWQFYIGGVFDLPCGKTLDHGILIVGYGVETDILGFHIPFWWVKNSWGASWGLSGYLKIKRGDCKCGLCEFACSSIINKSQ